MGSSIADDYKAIGNSLMIDTNHDSCGIREQLLSSSNISVSDIPAYATVSAAYLYWSGSLSDSRVQTVLSDSCDNFNKWVYGNS
jgi:hypothetical protein